MHYMAKTSKMQKKKKKRKKKKRKEKAKQVTQGMLCKDNMANLDYKSEIQNTIFLSPLLFLFFKFILKGIAKTPYHEMHECYVMQILKV